MKKLVLFCLIFANQAFAAEPNCKTQTLGDHSSKICVSSTPFQHDIYTLWVDGSPIFALPDDYVEAISLTHTIPQDAAIEYPLSKQGTPTVTIAGGCTPISEQQQIGGKTVGIEVGRTCSFKWGAVQVMDSLRLDIE
jgi:hypothetical protein